MESKYTKDKLAIAISESFTWVDVCKRFGSSTHGSSQAHAKSMAVRYGLDFSHFGSGCGGWNKGKPSERKKLPEDVFVVRKDKVRTKGQLLRRSLIEIGRDYKCSICGINEWNNELLILHVDHIDGDPYNNISENLRFLCPNCHSQTSTYGNNGNYNNRESCYNLTRWIDLYSIDVVKIIIESSFSLKEVIEKFDRYANGHNMKILSDFIQFNDIDISHFRSNCKKYFNDKKNIGSKSKNLDVCSFCGGIMYHGSKMCVKCYRKHIMANNAGKPRKFNRKVDRPSLDEVRKFVDENSYCAAGRKYGVSDNAVRKWLKSGIQ